jgi:hypothetical protein
MKRSVATIIGLALAALTFVGAPAATATPVAASAPVCAIRWGSVARSAPGMSTAALTGVRAGRHTCFDRVVLTVAGPVSGYSVQYVTQVRDQGRGAVVPLRGGARLEVVARVPANNVTSGAATFSPADPANLVHVSQFRTLRQVAYGGSFEGVTTIGVGVRARLPFRVFVLTGPASTARLVIDVAHRW